MKWIKEHIIISLLGLFTLLFSGFGMIVKVGFQAAVQDEVIKIMTSPRAVGALLDQPKVKNFAADQRAVAEKDAKATFGNDSLKMRVVLKIEYDLPPSKDLIEVMGEDYRKLKDINMIIDSVFNAKFELNKYKLKAM